MTQQLEIKTNLVLFMIIMSVSCQGVAGTTGDVMSRVEGFTRDLVLDKHPDAISFDINIKSPDPRIRLDECQQPELSLHGSNRLRSRILVKLDCLHSRSMHLAVDIAVYKPVLVTTTALSRQTVLTSADVMLQDLDVLANNRPLLTQTELAIGKKLKRSVRAGTMLTAGMLIEPTLVNRGDSVVIVAKKGSLMVRMPGIALAAGGMGEQISVRNESSERTVKGWIRAPGEIHVPL